MKQNRRFVRRYGFGHNRKQKGALGKLVSPCANKMQHYEMTHRWIRGRYRCFQRG